MPRNPSSSSVVDESDPEDLRTTLMEAAAALALIAVAQFVLLPALAAL